MKQKEIEFFKVIFSGIFVCWALTLGTVIVVANIMEPDKEVVEITKKIVCQDFEKNPYLEKQYPKGFEFCVHYTDKVKKGK